MVMRPYQIAATERILNRIEVSTNYKKMGTIDAGGYIWHTTGSGKTLTSFKTAQLASALPYVDKVLFVVDRKDLDYQTMKEYDRFEKGSANSNASTRVLQRQLEDRDEKGGYHQYKIIITTIQKLDNFVTRNKGHEVFSKHCVIIFDECHRSQFGDMHAKIVNYYKDLSMRVKNREVDLLIVVNMFLTGFDATTLNTLWVDKNLKMHGLIQAYSRTNRILNSVKTYGNIVCLTHRLLPTGVDLFWSRKKPT